MPLGICNILLKNKAGLWAVNLTFSIKYAIMLIGMGGFYPRLPRRHQNLMPTGKLGLCPQRNQSKTWLRPAL